MEQLKRAHSSSRLTSGAGISSATPQTPNLSSLALPNGPSREEISAGNRQSLIHSPGTLLVLKSFICKWVATAFHTKPTNPVKRSLEKLPGEEKQEEVERMREMNTIKRNRGKKWGGKRGAGDGPQSSAGMGMFKRGAVEG